MPQAYMTLKVIEGGEGIESNPEELITLAAVGDIMIGGDLLRVIEERGDVAHPFRRISGLLKGVDIAFGNLEGPLVGIGPPQVKGIALHSDPKAVEGLAYARFDILNLANNHALDYGEASLFETMSLLQKHKIDYVGAGRNLAESRRAKILERGGIKVAFLAYASSEIGSAVAGESKPGCAPLRLSLIKEDVGDAKGSADIIVVSLHWGLEEYNHPSPDQIRMAHEILEAGANIILGHHPHVLQGIEIYKGGLIAYSLGNFLFGNIWLNGSLTHWSERNRRSLIMKCAISKRGLVSVELSPTYTNDSYELVPLEGDGGQLLSKIREWSDQYKDPNYEELWRTIRKEREYDNGFLMKSLRNYRRAGLREMGRDLAKVRPVHIRLIVESILIKYGLKG